VRADCISASTVYIGIGSNLGQPLKQVRDAAAADDKRDPRRRETAVLAQFSAAVDPPEGAQSPGHPREIRDRIDDARGVVPRGNVAGSGSGSARIDRNFLGAGEDVERHQIRDQQCDGEKVKQVPGTKPRAFVEQEDRVQIDENGRDETEWVVEPPRVRHRQDKVGLREKFEHDARRADGEESRKPVVHRRTANGPNDERSRHHGGHERAQ